MTLNQEQLTNIIEESINNFIAEQKLKNHIKSLVRESLENFGDFSQYEARDNDEEDGRLSDMNTETDDEAETRDSLEKYFKRPGVNNAPYAYKLYGVKPKKGQDTNKMKNARKKFSASLNHKKNQKGYKYSFDSEELNSLKGMVSNNQLSEAINSAFKKILG